MHRSLLHIFSCQTRDKMFFLFPRYRFYLLLYYRLCFLSLKADTLHRLSSILLDALDICLRIVLGYFFALPNLDVWGAVSSVEYCSFFRKYMIYYNTIYQKSIQIFFCQSWKKLFRKFIWSLKGFTT